MRRKDVHIYVKKLPYIIFSSDNIAYSVNEHSEGLCFKKKCKDGTHISFVLVSNKKSTLTAKSICLETKNYMNKKRSISLTNDV